MQTAPFADWSVTVRFKDLLSYGQSHWHQHCCVFKLAFLWKRKIKYVRVKKPEPGPSSTEEDREAALSSSSPLEGDDWIRGENGILTYILAYKCCSKERRISFLTLSGLLRSVEKHFPPATSPSDVGPGDMGSIIPADCLLKITACRYIQALLLYHKGSSNGKRSDSDN